MIDRKTFLEFYKKLPEHVKKLAIVDLEKYGPCSWSVVYIEVRANTKISKLMLEKLNEKCLNCFLKRGI